MALHPDNGVRFECARTGVDEAGATYTMVALLPNDVRATYEVRANTDRTTEVGAPTVTPADAEAPEWVTKHACSLARQLAKSATWPRRFQRWKAAP